MDCFVAPLLTMTVAVIYRATDFVEGVTRHMALPTSSATSSAPCLSSRTPTVPKLTLVTVLVTTKVGPLVLRREFLVPDAAPTVPVRTEEDALMKT